VRKAAQSARTPDASRDSFVAACCGGDGIHSNWGVRISIIIPAFDEERLIGLTLERVKAATAAFAERGWESEVIVCDNNSTDATATLAKAAGAKVVFEPVNQIARARNRGAEAATGDWLLFVDADSQASQELLREVAERITAGRCLAGGSTIKWDGDYPLGKRVLWLWNGLSRCFKLLAGSFVFCEAYAFREVGGFSQELFAGEELDLTLRLRRLARQHRKTLVILHRHPLVTSGRKMQLYSLGEHVRFFLKALAWRRVLTRRDACRIWYDGRR
jgi:glycosyltransferase involved in cell wall biosynthesis